MVVATRDRPHLLGGLLDALDATLRPGDELVVVDSASRSGATARLCAARGVRVVRVEQAGTSRARNAGWRGTSAPLVAFTDDDCLPQRGWADALETALQQADLVTGRVLPDRVVSAPVSVLDDLHPRDLTPEVVVGHGACCGLRRDLLERLEGFDERLGPGTALRAGEDADLFRRAVAIGALGRYDPSAVVVHRQWRGRGAALRQSFAYGVGQAGSATRRGEPVRPAVWDDGLRAAGRDLRAGYLSGAAAGALRGAGAVAGAVLGRRSR